MHQKTRSSEVSIETKRATLAFS